MKHTLSKKERLLSWLLLVLTFLPLVTALIGIQFLPDRIPMHYNFAGEIDRWGSKWEMLIVGGVFCLSGLILWLIARFSGALADTETERVRAEANAHLLRVIGIGTQLFLTALGVVMMVGAAREAAAGATESVVPLLKLLGVGMGLLYLFLGNVMPKAKPNAVVGVRLPWLDGNGEAWRKTQRAGGIAFALGGAACILFTLLLPNAAALGVILLCTLAPAVAACVISYRYSRE